MPDEGTSQPTYAERQSAILSELSEPVGDSIQQTDSAPDATTNAATPAPAKDSPTGESVKGTGSQTDGDDRHAGDVEHATDGDDEKVTLTKAEIQARIAEATRRATADQAKTARELRAAREEANRLKERVEQTGFDARVLYQAQERLKQIAREQGAVGYTDLDDATNDAIRAQSAIHQQTKAQEAEAERQRADAQRVIDGEAGNRTTYGKSLHSDTVVAVMEAAQESGQRITAAQAREAIKTAYSDKAVRADIADFQDLSLPPDKARARADVAFARIKDIAVAGITQAAVAKINAEREERKPGTFDRRQVHGETRGQGPSYSKLKPAERRALVMAELNDDSDLRF